ncbi:hypothetical protein [Streptomyces violaceusniger]|uniref:Uncharacterized protein n=1 Tax=Streptomyces violaceusniger (strain Tu 4113) TaxID=653045 RepID=G2NY35_STRV4|nr:hypothetical protein [Streptomyces violaceusniger]AEM81524.1 hypothetical protein Strvi_1787 [Streptomyces violaceusniger Tu 4113]
MTAETLAEDLELDNLVERITLYGTVVIRLTQVEHRVNGIKFTGRTEAGTQYCFGLKYGEPATRVDERPIVGAESMPNQ